MLVTGSYSGVYSLVACILQGLGGSIDIALHGTGKGADNRPCYGFRNLYYRVEIARAAGRKSCLNHIHPQLLELTSHLNLLNGVELASRDLFAVPECGVKENQSV